MSWDSLSALNRRSTNRLLGGVVVTGGAISVLGFLSRNSEILLDGQTITVSTALTVQSEYFSELSRGATLTIAGSPYRVLHEPLLIGDGSDCVIPIEEVGDDDEG